MRAGQQWDSMCVLGRRPAECHTDYIPQYFSLMMSPVCLCILYSMFRAAGWRMLMIIFYTNSDVHSGHCSHFPFKWTLFCFWLKRSTQSMVLPDCADPLSNHESVPAQSIWDCVIKYRGYTLQQWGEHGTPPKNPLPSNFNPCDVSFLPS